MAQSVGLHNPRYLLHLHNLITWKRLVEDAPTIYQYYDKSVLVEEFINASFYELSLTLLTNLHDIPKINFNKLERLIVLREELKNDESIKKLLQSLSLSKIEGELRGIYLEKDVIIIKTFKNSNYYYFEQFHMDLRTNNINAIKEESQYLLKNFDKWKFDDFV